LPLLLLLALQTVQARQQANLDQLARPAATGADTLKLAEKLVPDTMPELPGGEHDMLMFITRNIRYPTAAMRAGKQGVVLLSFTAKADGVIEDIKVLNSLGKDLDRESIRVVKLMPKWKPALSNAFQ
jgi:TonB family protein